MPSDRAVCVCFDGDRVLVMRRVKNGQQYTVLPGGGVEAGENPAGAVLRELAEETGLAGTIIRDLGSIRHPDRLAHYFLVRVVPGPLQVGGPESARQSADNQYSLAWVAVGSLDDEPLVPEGIREIIREAAAGDSRNCPASASTDGSPSANLEGAAFPCSSIGRASDC